MNPNGINFDALGITGIFAVLFLVLVNVAKGKKIPITIPPQWRPLAAGAGAAVATAATLHLMGTSLKTALLCALVATFLPGGIHGVVAQPEAETPAKPTTVENTAELGAAVAAAMPATSSVTNNTVKLDVNASPEQAQALGAGLSLAPPPVVVEPPTPAAGGSS